MFEFRYIVEEGPLLPPLEEGFPPLTHSARIPGSPNIIHFTNREDAEEYAAKQNQWLEWRQEESERLKEWIAQRPKRTLRRYPRP